MTYIENVFLCLAAPLVVAVFCVHRFRRRSFLFILSGMVACLFASYISTFFARVLSATVLQAQLEISPVIEEILKLIPIAFYMMVYEPEKDEAAGEALMIAVGFATLENALYLLTSGADSSLYLLIRGFSTGAMHVVCGAMTAVVLRGMWDSLFFRTIAMLGVLCLTIVCHGIYNILVNQSGIPAYIGYLLPVIFGGTTIIARRKMYGESIDSEPKTELQKQ